MGRFKVVQQYWHRISTRDLIVTTSLPLGTTSETYNCSTGQTTLEGNKIDVTCDIGYENISEECRLINNAPISIDGSIELEQDSSIALELTATDDENDNLVFSIENSPANGVISGTLPNITYTPNEGFFGTDTFTFKANDGNSHSNISTVSINVTELILDGPVYGDVAILNNGSVITWGNVPVPNELKPYDLYNNPNSRLQNGIVAKIIVLNMGSYVALLSDGSVVAWGSSSQTGGVTPDELKPYDSSTNPNSLLQNGTKVKKIIASQQTFTALLSNGDVYSWGTFPGSISSITTRPNVTVTENYKIIDVFANSGAYSALMSDGTIKSWGARSQRGNPPIITSTENYKVEKIIATDLNFMAIMSDESYLRWGQSPQFFPEDLGGRKITDIAATTSNTIVMLLDDGSIESCCNSTTAINNFLKPYDVSTNTVSRLNNGVTIESIHGYNNDVFSSEATTAMAAILSDGSLVSWGSTQFGGRTPPELEPLSKNPNSLLQNNVTVESVTMSNLALGALLSNGTVWTWGNYSLGGNTPNEVLKYDEVSNPNSLVREGNKVNELFAGRSSFAAVFTDGSLVSWGGVSSPSLSDLSSGLRGYPDPNLAQCTLLNLSNIDNSNNKVLTVEGDFPSCQIQSCDSGYTTSTDKLSCEQVKISGNTNSV